MPSPIPPPPIGRQHFPSHRQPKRNAAPIPPRAQKLIELMTLGPGDGKPPMTIQEAAAHMRIKQATADGYFRHPRARAHYLRLVNDLRTGEMMKNTLAAVGIRDDKAMAETAAGNRARIEAMRFLEGDVELRDDAKSHPSVTPGVVVQINVDRPREPVDDTIIEVNANPVSD